MTTTARYIHLLTADGGGFLLDDGGFLLLVPPELADVPAVWTLDGGVAGSWTLEGSAPGNWTPEVVVGASGWVKEGPVQ